MTKGESSSGRHCYREWAAIRRSRSRKRSLLNFNFSTAKQAVKGCTTKRCHRPGRRRACTAVRDCAAAAAAAVLDGHKSQIPASGWRRRSSDEISFSIALDPSNFHFMQKRSNFVTGKRPPRAAPALDAG
ncbi:hypothetical protein EVAR_61826_1 [Eumeta japonica]|uniref:Uncharacterized protein n=1 Tax=Eumeta variegata TaxID=151549 RepID=A0A4C1YSE2_EUMVA|nr:hypothetical protein EVAR_61826_1 [Eumeta japonica]